jgi:4-hydroxy-L-threonine phosphate dehydrogenase PdxA
MGDAAGIGPEIIVQGLRRRATLADAVVLGDVAVLRACRALASLARIEEPGDRMPPCRPAACR